jgi:hypothetical protein
MLLTKSRRLQMSFAQRAIAEDERKQHTAAVIAAKVGVLERCEFGICDDLTWDDSEEQHKSAYKYAARLFKSKDSLTQVFRSQKELTDMIKNLWNDFGDECACKRLIAKD